MAYKPKRPCMERGCPNLVTDEFAHRCPEHQREYLRKWSKPRDVKYSSGSWRKLSKIFLRHNPICNRCGAPSVLAHHIIRKRDGGSDDWDNLEALCASCHEREHRNERWGRNREG